MLEFKEYTDGKKTIRATVKAYETIYRNQGFKPATKTAAKSKGSGSTDNGESNKANAGEVIES